MINEAEAADKVADTLAAVKWLLTGLSILVGLLIGLDGDVVILAMPGALIIAAVIWAGFSWAEHMLRLQVFITRNATQINASLQSRMTTD